MRGDESEVIELFAQFRMILFSTDTQASLQTNHTIVGLNDFCDYSIYVMSQRREGLILTSPFNMLYHSTTDYRN
jgi:hypothetical protein